MIEATRACVLSTFKRYQPDVIYGDTDSVFVLVNQPSDKEAWRIANEIASTARASSSPGRSTCSRTNASTVSVPFQEENVCRTWK